MATIAQTRTNLATNPSVEGGATNWTDWPGPGGTASGAVSTATAGYAGASFFRVTWSVATTSPNGGVIYNSTPVTPGTVYTGSMYVRCSKAQTLYLAIEWHDASNAIISTSAGPNVSVPAGTGQWTRLSSVAATAPANAATGVLIAYTSSTLGLNWAAGDWMDGDAALIEASSTLGGYFDGSFSPVTVTAGYSPAASWVYSWTGAANASASTARLTVPLQNYQVQLPDGTIVGAGIKGAQLAKITGLRDLAPLRSGDLPRGSMHGMFPGQNYLSSRHVTLTWLILLADGVEAALETLSKAMQVISDPSKYVITAGDYLRQQAGITPTLPVSSLQVQLPGRAYPMLLLGRPEKHVADIDMDYQYGKVTPVTSWEVPDGSVYDANVITGSCGLPNPTSGHVWGSAWPWDWGNSSGGSFNLDNAGNMPAYPFFKVTGPCTNPTITNNATGEFIQIGQMTLATGDVLTVDCQNGTVLLNGESRSGYVAQGSTFFSIGPGTTSIGFSTTDSAQVSGKLYGYALATYSLV